MAFDTTETRRAVLTRYWTRPGKDCTFPSVRRLGSGGLSQESRDMAASGAPSGLIDYAVRSLSAEAFSGNLAARDWVIRQGPTRRAHLLVIETRNGTAALRGTKLAFS